MKLFNKAVPNLVLTGMCMVMLLQIYPNGVSAHHSDLESTIYQYERYVGEKRYSEAFSLLYNHKSEIKQLFKDQAPIEIKNELISILNNNLSMLSNDNYDDQAKTRSSLKLVLAVDAIKNENNALWHQWKADLDNLITAKIESDHYTNEDLQEIVLNWELIKPAMAIAVDKEKFNTLNNSFLQLNSNNANKKELQDVYERSKQVAITPINKDSFSFFWLATVVGGLIAVTLSYVGWKKYKGEKNKPKRQRS